MKNTYFPIEENDYRIILGLQPIRDKTWIDIDEQYEDQIALKRNLIKNQDDKVFNTLEGREAPSEEIYSLIKGEIAKNYPKLQTIEIPEQEHPLMRAACIVQEDLVLMQPRENGYILGAACVCFPTGWNLTEKIGKPLWDIHKDVPGLNDRIGHSINLFFRNLKSDKKVKRFNWGLYDSDALFQPLWWRKQQTTSADISNQTVGDRMTFRVEKQTLQRLSNSDDILFTIRIFNSPLSEISADADRKKALLHAIQTMPPAMQEYKDLTPHKDVIIRHLED